MKVLVNAHFWVGTLIHTKGRNEMGCFHRAQSPFFVVTIFDPQSIACHRLLICFLTILCIYLFSFYFSHIMNFQPRLVLYVVSESNGFGVFRHSKGFGAELQSFDNKRYWNDDFIEVFHIMDIIPFLIRNDRLIPLMEEILHHLGCMKPCKWWDKLPTKWCRISSINSIINHFY